MSRKLKTILAFLDRGVAILPLSPEANAPAVAGGVKAAVTDRKTLTRFYTKHSNFSYGLALGDGVFVVRVKGRPSKSRLHEIADEHGERLPTTTTLRIGRARYYLFAAKGMQIRSSKGLIGKGIDVLGTGEYVPGPESKLASGARCKFAEGRALGDVEIAKSPKWLSKMVAANSGTAVGQQPSDSSKTLGGEPDDSAGGAKHVEPPTSTTKRRLRIMSVAINDIWVAGDRRECNAERVNELAASMAAIGLKTPITVRKKAGKRKPVLVAGLHRLEAARSLGWQVIDAFLLRGGKREARLWAICREPPPRRADGYPTCRSGQ